VRVRVLQPDVNTCTSVSASASEKVRVRVGEKTKAASGVQQVASP
jgi:hypothetical protein